MHRVILIILCESTISLHFYKIGYTRRKYVPFSGNFVAYIVKLIIGVFCVSLIAFCCADEANIEVDITNVDSKLFDINM